MVGDEIFKSPETVRETKLNEGFVRKLILKNLAKFEPTGNELAVEGGEEGIKDVLSTHPGVKNFVNIHGKVFIDLAKGSTATQLIQELEGQTTIKDLKVIGKMSQPIVDESKLNIT